MTRLAPTSPAPERPSPLRALRHHDFRLLWGGQAVSSVGTWMQVVAQSLLVLRLSDNDALALGAVALAQAAAFLAFSLLGGSVADRFERRRLLLITQGSQMLLALLLGLLTALGMVNVPVVVLLAFLTGVAASFDQPARAALTPSLVPREDLMSANALLATTNNTAATLGPVLAGLVAAWSLESAFFLNAVSFLGMLVALALLRSTPAPAIDKVSMRGPRAMYEGLAVVWQDDRLPWVVGGYGLLLLVGPSPSLLLPLFAQGVLDVGGTELGWLFSAFGIGTVLGALGSAALARARSPEVLLGVALGVWALALLAFALSRTLPPALLALLVLGATRNMAGVSATALMQLRAPDDKRGRVMSLNTLLSGGLRPFGDFAAGGFMAALPLPLVVGTSAALVGTFSLQLLRRFATAGRSGQRSGHAREESSRYI